jgi:hypothetical protein
VSDISLHWRALDLVLIVLLAGLPGLAAGSLWGGLAWRTHRLRGATLGAFAGFILCLALWFICFSSRIAQADGFSGAVLMAAKIAAPGLVLGGIIAAWRFGERWIVAAIAGAAIGAVAWLGGWAALS